MSYKLLIAEDDADVRQMLVRLLEEDYEIVTAADGFETINRIKSEKPDLILLDHMMPGMSGGQVYGHLKMHDIQIPAILMTGHTRAEEIAEAIEADACLQKPIDIAQLERTIKSILQIGEAPHAAQSCKDARHKG